MSLNGTLTAVDQAQYANGTCATGKGLHAAVWLLKAQQSNGSASVQFPIYVDDQTTTTQDKAFFSYTMQFCAGSAGQNVIEVDLGLVRMFVNPAARGIYLWRAAYEPATSDGKSVQADQSVSVASAVPIDAQVTVASRRIARKPGWRMLSGVVTAGNHALGNVKVQLFVGHQRRLALNRPRVTVRTKADGTYSVALRLTGKRARRGREGHHALSGHHAGRRLLGRARGRPGHLVQGLPRRDARAVHGRERPDQAHRLARISLAPVCPGASSLGTHRQSLRERFGR